MRPSSTQRAEWIFLSSKNGSQSEWRVLWVLNHSNRDLDARHLQILPMLGPDVSGLLLQDPSLTPLSTPNFRRDASRDTKGTLSKPNIRYPSCVIWSNAYLVICGCRSKAGPHLRIGVRGDLRSSDAHRYDPPLLFLFWAEFRLLGDGKRLALHSQRSIGTGTDHALLQWGSTRCTSLMGRAHSDLAAVRSPPR